jgi:transcriptional regulator with XRE-family HTH domain
VCGGIIERGRVFMMNIKYPVIDMVRTGQNIRQIMQLKGLSVKDIKEFLGLNTTQSVYHWIDGRNLPTPDNLYALSELFQIPIDALLIGNRIFKCEFQSDMHRRMLVYNEKFMGLRAG